MRCSINFIWCRHFVIHFNSVSSVDAMRFKILNLFFIVVARYRHNLRSNADILGEMWEY